MDANKEKEFEDMISSLMRESILSNAREAALETILIALTKRVDPEMAKDINQMLLVAKKEMLTEIQVNHYWFQGYWKDALNKGLKED